MASISTRGNGRWFVRFIDLHGDRKTMSLDTKSERQATTIKLQIENILSAKGTGQAVDPSTAAWLANLERDKAGRRLRLKLISAGLVEADAGEPLTAAAPEVLTLGKFLERYFQKRTDVKQSTHTNWAHTRRNLLAFFGKDKPLAEITIADAKDFERFLKMEARQSRYGNASEADGLMLATRHKRIGNAKQFFQDAVDAELLAKNPFAGLESSRKANDDRRFFITQDAAYRVLEACPDADWRLLFALCRFGGLRCPSETLGLRLGDVVWEKDRFLVHSPKTEHHEGKASRWVPIFPELRPYLSDAWDEAQSKKGFFLERFQGKSEAYFRTMLMKIIRRAGLDTWPKLFQNLRSTRQTELEETFPTHVVCAWIGNSPQVARAHYLQITDDHFDRATAERTGKASGALADALQKRSTLAPQDIAQDGATPPKPARNRIVSHSVPLEMGVTGLEPCPKTLGKTGLDAERSIFVATAGLATRLEVFLDGREVELSEADRAEIMAILTGTPACR